MIIIITLYGVKIRCYKVVLTVNNVLFENFAGPIEKKVVPETSISTSDSVSCCSEGRGEQLDELSEQMSPSRLWPTNVPFKCDITVP